jgi:serine/threonine protein kinase
MANHQQSSPCPKIAEIEIQGYGDGQHGLKIKRGDDQGSIAIYDIDPESHAASTDLTEGCEILSINGHLTKNSVTRCEEMLDYFTAKLGRFNILVSMGCRPLGTMYLMAKNPKQKDCFDGVGFIIDGLELHEERGGRVRVDSVGSGCFNHLKMNKGDDIWTIDGKEIYCVDDARIALKEATGNHIPILTYNIFRRMKSAVMSNCTSRSLKNGKAQHITDLYDIHETLGEGSFAVVKKATHKVSGAPYAIKIINRSSLNKDLETALKEEISILSELNHSHIMKLETVVCTLSQIYLVTEYLEGGELFDRVVEKSSYTESEARDSCKIVFEALRYAHSKGVVHRDLKPENLLLQYRDSDSEIKIADFGFAKKAMSDHSLQTVCGTPGYVAPEILRMEKYGTKSDLWSMGVITYILLGGYPPFYASNDQDLFRMTKRGDFEFHEDHWGEISKGVKDMISSMLVTDPARRASASDVLAHPWMNEDEKNLRRRSLISSKDRMKKYIARQRLKTAVHGVIFLKSLEAAKRSSREEKRVSICHQNAVFAGKKKRLSLTL